MPAPGADVFGNSFAMINTSLSPDGTRATHIVEGDIGTAELLQAIYKVRGPALTRVIWDLRRARITMTDDKLAATIKVTFPASRPSPLNVFFLPDEDLAQRTRELMRRISPPWSWRVSHDSAEADRYLADSG